MSVFAVGEKNLPGFKPEIADVHILKREGTHHHLKSEESVCW